MCSGAITNFAVHSAVTTASKSRSKVMAKIIPALAISATMLLGAAYGSSPAVPDTGWPSYNNGLDSARFSQLTSITPATAPDLREACEIALGDDGSFQTGPLAIGDTLFVTTAHTTVALGATDCSLQWRHVYTPEEQEIYPVNRGVAYLDGRIFRGTADGRLLAIDAKTGKELWRVQAGDPKLNEFLSAAPIAWNGILFIGIAGSDWGIRGRMMAFDAATGKELWRFNTIPAATELGAETWQNVASLQHGGGGTWTSFTLDTATGELFVPVGNPAPDFLPASRPGDNLYTNSLIVLDATTGALRWYHQFDPHDGLDYDVSAAPALYSDADGNRRIALGSKDGYLYILDRNTHGVISKTPITTITNPDLVPSSQPQLACPGDLGGVEWNGPAVAPPTGLIYVGSVDWCDLYTAGEAKYAQGQLYFGTGTMPPQDTPARGWIYALDGRTGKLAWRYHADMPVVAGITPTAGGVVFAGDMGGNLLVFNAGSGKVISKQNAGGPLAGGIITYAEGGKQYVAFAAGNVSRLTFTNVAGTPRIVVMTTGLPQNHQPVMVAAVEPGQTVANAAAHGQATFAQFCSGCHGAQGTGGTGPSLQHTKRNGDELVQFIENPKAPMPKLYPSPLNDADVSAVAQYVETLR
jgi:PQQ-dependent dehydrogenase (methanol/ethanol family)